VVTAIRPQDIIENQEGTKVFFAGWGDGLHELVKATNTWTNYTTSNSDLIANNGLNTLQVDANDLLYIGNFQGLNTITPAGVWNTYQQLVPPNNVWFYPVYEISKNETTGDLLIRSSTPNSASNFGLTLLDLTTNTWTNYTDDNTNCLNSNSFSTTTLGGDGAIYAIKTFTGEVFKFNNSTNNCTQLDINYLNSSIAANSSQISGITTRTRSSGVIDIGFTQGGSLHILEIDPDTYNGMFPTTTTIVPSPGQSAFSVLSDNDYFIIENDTGWTFVDGNNNITSFNHNLSNYLAIDTQKAAAFSSDAGIITLIHKGFDASWNYRVYKTQCNTVTATCSAPEEIFNTNRDLTQNIFYRCRTNNGVVTCFGVKTLPPPGGNATRVGVNMGVESISWDDLTNNPASPFFDESISFVPDNKKPMVFIDENGDPVLGVLQNSALNIRDVDAKGNPFFTPSPIDIDSDGQEDKILNSSPQEVISGQVNEISLIGLGPLTFFFKTGYISLHTEIGIDVSILNEDNSSFNEGGVNLDFDTRDILMAAAESGNFFYFKTKNKKTTATNEALLVLLTNYGILIKAGIDVSNLTLSTDNVSLNDTKVLLYPNPANDIVSFSNNSIKNITVYDINGRNVLNTTNSNSFSVKTLAQGVYIVKGTSDTNVVVTKKLVVE
jgi:hypothetical protein